MSYQNNTNNDTENGYVEINKFWDFIKAIIVGADRSECGITAYNYHEIYNINEELGYFYSKRLLKWPARY